MHHKNSVFHDLLKLIPWTVFDALVERHGSDELVRKFATRHQLIALLYAQFSGADSLRAIKTALTSHQARLYHIGGKVPARSTFADANRTRSPLVFTGLFEHLLCMADRKMRWKMREAVRLIDSTSLHLAGAGCEGAVLARRMRREGACGLRPRPRSSGLSCRHRGQDQ